MSADERGRILHDFADGKAFLLAEFALRTRTWTQLPLKLFCLGHWDMAVVRQHAAQCLVLYDNLPAGQARHAWTEKLLSPQGTLRPMIEALVLGHQGFDDLPELQHERAKTQFAPIIEISIEHAQLHRSIRLAPRHSGAFASIMLRKGEVISAMEADADRTSRDLAAHLHGNSTVSACVLGLHLLTHPVLAPHLRDGFVHARLPHHIVVRIVYRCDTQTQFMDLPSVQVH